MTDAPPSSRLRRAKLSSVRNRTSHFELIGQTLGGIFATLPPESLRPRSSARVRSGFVQLGFCVDGASPPRRRQFATSEDNARVGQPVPRDGRQVVRAQGCAPGRGARLLLRV